MSGKSLRYSIHNVILSSRAIACNSRKRAKLIPSAGHQWFKVTRLSPLEHSNHTV